MSKNKSYIECLENISSNFDKMKDDIIYMKEKLYEFKKKDKIYINFKECHIAICPNGGLIAICKKKGYLDITKNSRINDFIIVIHQNFRNNYFIKIDWDYKQKYFILLDFNEKEQLYGICNDGYIFKIDILTKRAIPKLTSDKFREENIVKAKLFEDGFIALTTKGNFYYIKDIKNPIAELFFDMKSLLHFSNNIEFLIIPSSVSKSKKIELLITNEKGYGVIHIEKMEDGIYYIVPIDKNNEVLAYKGISILKKDKLEPFVLSQENINDMNSLDNQKQESQYQYENLRNIAAMAISPSKKNIALYDKRGIVFFFDSTLDLDLKKNPRIEAQIKMVEGLPTNEIMEQQIVLNYGEGFQFLFCGEDSVILSGLSLLFLIHKIDKYISYEITEEEAGEKDILKQKLYSKCISEVDGIRILTNDGIYFISKISKDLIDICTPFSNSYPKKLIQAYQNYMNKSINTEKSLREIGKNLINAVNSLLIVAGNIFWIGDEEENFEKKETQLFVLKAAQYGKTFVKKDEFNYDKFLEICKDIRCVNNLRNHSTIPRLITFNEYKNLNSKDLIKKTMRMLNFGLAFEICHFLDYSDKKVYQRYAISKIKNISFNIDEEEEEKIFNILNEKLKNVKNLSFIKLAKKAFKYHKNIIGIKFLENEKSVLSKIPQYIELMKWDEAIDLAENIYDFNIINTVLYKIFKKEKIKDFINIVSQHPKAKAATIQFIQKNACNKMENYLKNFNNPEELFFYYLEQYFQTQDISERKKYISLAKEKMKLIDNTINPNFEHKFYKNYLESLDNNLAIKIETQNQDINLHPDEIAFDISIYDFYKIEINQIIDEKSNLIETQNKKIGFSQEGLNIMRLMAYGEKGSFIEMDALLKKNNNNIKKMGLTYLNLAEIYYKYKKYDTAIEYIKSINDSFYIEYKVQMLEYINKYEDALEAIISDKNIDSNEYLIDNIIRKKPELKNKVEELLIKYNVKLNK